MEIWRSKMERANQAMDQHQFVGASAYALAANTKKKSQLCDRFDDSHQAIFGEMIFPRLFFGFCLDLGVAWCYAKCDATKWGIGWNESKFLGDPL